MKHPFVHRRKVLFGDCDPSGLLYTPRAAHFVVEASMAFMRDRLGEEQERELTRAGVVPPTRAMSLEFMKPMKWDDELELLVTPLELRKHTLVLAFSGLVAGNEVMKAQLSIVFASTSTMRPIEIPAAVRRAMAGEDDAG